MSPKKTDEAPVVLAPADFSLSIFNELGHIRDLSDSVAQIEALADDQRAALFAMIECDKINIAAASRHVAARTAVREKSDAYNLALNAYNGNVLQVSMDGKPLFTAELKTDPRAKAMAERAARDAAIAAQSPGYIAKPVKANPLKPALDKAETELADARVELIRATQDETVASERYSTAIIAWRALQPKLTRETLMADHVKRGQEERARRVAAGLPADAPATAPDPSTSPLQAAMQARGKMKNEVRIPQYLGSNNVATPGSGRPILRV